MRSTAIFTSALLASTSFAPLAWGQTQSAGQDQVSLDDIVVTAQKRSERLSDVPLSITAASGEQLASQGISQPSDLGRIVPGFSYQQSTFGNPVFTIRGIGLYDTSIGVSPTVSVYVDQVPLPYLAMTAGAGLDLERLEALKGPQGILFGQNSTGGAINYIAAKPTRDPKMGFDVSYGRFNRVNGNAYVSGPITGNLTARLAVRHEYQDPWQISETRPDDRLGKRDFTAARLLLDWTPTDRLTLEFNANGWWDKSDSQAAQFRGFKAARPPARGGYPEAFAALGNRPHAPHDARIADWDAGFDYGRDDRFHQLSLRGDLELGGGPTLTSITAYSNLKSYIPSDADGTDFNDLSVIIDGKIKSFSQELRLAGNVGTLLNFTVGGNYQRDRVAEDNIGRFLATNSGVGPFRYRDFINRSDQTVSTHSVFASVDVNLTDTITAQGGLRYTDQNRHFRGCLADPGDGILAAGVAALPTLAGLPYNPAPAGSCVTLEDVTFRTLPVIDRRLDEDNLSWRAGLNWKAMRDTLVYANVTKGYKAGSFTPLPAIFASQLTPVTQESVLAYEVGFKTELFDRRLQLAGAAFYYQYRNKQILAYRTILPFGNLTALQNIPKSSVRGAELSATLRPVNGLRLTGGVTYVNSRVDASFIAPDPFATPVDLKGESFPNTPQWQFVSDAEYEVPVSEGLKAFVGGSFVHRSSTNAVFGRNPEFVIDGYSLIDLRMGLEAADGRWRIQLWGKNITNKYYLVNVAHVTDATAALVGQPVSYGVTLSSRF